MFGAWDLREMRLLRSRFVLFFFWGVNLSLCISLIKSDGCWVGVCWVCLKLSKGTRDSGR